MYNKMLLLYKFTKLETSVSTNEKKKEKTLLSFQYNLDFEKSWLGNYQTLATD